MLQFGFAQLSKKALLSPYFTNLALCKLCKIIWILHFSQGQKISALLLLLALLIRYVFDSKFMDQTISFNCRFFQQKEKYIYILFSSTKLSLVIWISTYKHLHFLEIIPKLWILNFHSNINSLESGKFCLQSSFGFTQTQWTQEMTKLWYSSKKKSIK